MSVLSLKTAVIWAKPLRENDQVFSSPGMPASATSMGNVTCFSISRGDSAGAKALTCTWTLVMSGTASIGSLVSDHTPDAEAASVNSSTSQRFRTEKARMRSIMARSILGQRFQEFGLEQERVAHRDLLAGTQPRNDLDDPVIALTQDHLTFQKAVMRAHEGDGLSAHGLDRTRRHGKRGGLLLERNCGRDEGAGPPNAAGVGDLGHDVSGPGVLVEHWADERDLTLGSFGDAPGGDRHRLPLLDQREVGGAHGDFDPNAIEIG